MLLGLACLVCACSVSEQGPPAPGLFRTEEPNVLLVVFDSLRADHLGAYGYARPTSPFFDRLAGEGVVFEDALSNSSFTQESISSLMTGLLPSRSGSIGWGAQPPDHLDTLGESFAKMGYRTAFLSNTPVLRSDGYRQGFDVFDVADSSWNVSGQGHRLVEAFSAFLSQREAEPFFAYVHFLDPHAPYRPERELYDRLASSAPLEKPLGVYAIQEKLEELTLDGFGPGDSRFEDLVLRYDAEIATVDERLRDLFDVLVGAGLDGNTVLVLTSDHGEEFLEHGYLEHAWSLHREVLHVPLVLWSARSRPGRVAETVSLVDLFPSLLHLAGASESPGGLDGRSFFSDSGDWMSVTPTRRAQISELLLNDRLHTRAITTPGWKLIAATRWLDPPSRAGIRADPSAPAPEWDEPFVERLYSLPVDVLEEKDLSSEELEARERLSGAIGRYVRETDPSTSRPLSAEELRSLQSLGYL